MKRDWCFALLTAVLAGGTCLAQTGQASLDSQAAPRQQTSSLALRAAAQQPPAPGAPAPQAGSRGGFGGPIELGPDDKPAFPDPPAGFNVKRDNIPHGELTAVQYESKTLGTRRQIRVYLPPGYSPNRKYPVLFLLHGLGWNDLEWTEVRHADIVMDNLIADGKVQPMVMVFPNGDSSMTAADIAAAGGGAWMGRGAGGARGAPGQVPARAAALTSQPVAAALAAHVAGPAEWSWTTG